MIKRDAHVGYKFMGFGTGYEVWFTTVGENGMVKHYDSIYQARDDAIEFLFKQLVIEEDQPCMKTS